MTVSTYIYEGAVLAGLAKQGDACPALNKRFIKAMSVTNPTTVAVDLTVAIVNPTFTRTHISARTINPGETYTCLELINKGLSPAGYVSAGGAGLEIDYVATQISNG
jgi:hypothetical protein